MKFLKILPAILIVILFAGHAQGKETQAVTVKELVKSNMSRDGMPLSNYPLDKPEIAILRISIPSGANRPLLFKFN